MDAVSYIRIEEEEFVGAIETDLKRARRIATLMDAEVSVFGFKVGLDPLVGLIPVIGDMFGLVVGMYPIYIAHKHKLGAGAEARMAVNLAIDTAIGIIPILGDVFDAMFRANLKNVAILEGAIHSRRTSKHH